MEVPKVLQYLFALIIVLVIIVIIVNKCSVHTARDIKVRFGDPNIMIFDKNQPAAKCRGDYTSPKKNKLEWMRLHMPTTMRKLGDMSIPGYDDSSTKFHDFPTLDDEINGRVPLKHRQFTTAESVGSHIEFSGFNTDQSEDI